MEARPALATMAPLSTTRVIRVPARQSRRVRHQSHGRPVVIGLRAGEWLVWTPYGSGTGYARSWATWADAWADAVALVVPATVCADP